MKSEEIKKARAALGLTQTKFGELLHAKLRTVQAWEAGTRNMQPITRELLERKLQEKGNDCTFERWDDSRNRPR